VRKSRQPRELRDTSERQSPREEYVQKLQDPRWQKMRLKVLERDEWTCQKCSETESTLHVHHRYYLKNAAPWEYPLDALQTLCEDCHADETEHRGAAEHHLLQSLRMHGLFHEDVFALADALNFSHCTRVPPVIISTLAWAMDDPDIMDKIVDAYFTQLKMAKDPWQRATIRFIVEG
jgi:hypothetical protein